MFMQPIDHPVLQRARKRRTRSKLVAGVLAIAILAPVMALWWIATALWLPVAALVGMGRSAARSGYDIALYAGEAVIGS